MNKPNQLPIDPKTPAPVGLHAVVRPRVITLTEEVRQDVPLAYMVFCHKDIDHDYMVFPDYHEAQSYAMEQEERAEMPEDTYPIYALWATRWPNDKLCGLRGDEKGTQ